MNGSRVVLVFIKGLGLGGAERLVADAARYWDRVLFDYHVAYVLPWKDHLVPALVERGVPVHVIGGGSDPDWGAPVRLRRLIKEIDATLVHAHLPSAGVVARVASPVPVVYTEHNLADSYRLPTRLANYSTYWRNRAVFAVSDAVASSLKGYPGPLPMTVPNGVSLSASSIDAAAARGELGIDAGRPLIVHVGNIRPHKGHATLVAAAAHLEEARPDAVVVSIGGEKHAGDLSRLEDRVRALGLENLRFLGRREDALNFVAAADVFVNPADVEGLPVAILEAMALGTPVVATEVGGVPSVIRDGETGLLCPPGKPEVLARGVLELVANTQMAARLAASARELVESDYGLEPMVRRVERVYQGILDG